MRIQIRSIRMKRPFIYAFNALPAREAKNVGGMNGVVQSIEKSDMDYLPCIFIKLLSKGKFNYLDSTYITA